MRKWGNRKMGSGALGGVFQEFGCCSFSGFVRNSVYSGTQILGWWLRWVCWRPRLGYQLHGLAWSTSFLEKKEMEEGKKKEREGGREESRLFLKLKIGTMCVLSSASYRNKRLGIHCRQEFYLWSEWSEAERRKKGITFLGGIREMGCLWKEERHPGFQEVSGC